MRRGPAAAKPQEPPTGNSHDQEWPTTSTPDGGPPPLAELGHRIDYRLADVEHWLAEWTRPGTVSVGDCDLT